MRRPPDKHIDNAELDALVSWPVNGKPPARTDNEVQGHVESCELCSRKVEEYSRLVQQLSARNPQPKATPCTAGEDVNWREVAAGLWPEQRARQLITHAAMCDQCGPLLRDATSRQLTLRQNEPEPQLQKRALSHSRFSFWQRQGWLVPALLFLMVIGAIGISRSITGARMSGPDLAEFASNIQRQYSEGSLPLDIASESPRDINQWLKGQLDFSLSLPAAPPVPGETRPFQLEGARVVKVGGRKAAFIAYKVHSEPASLTVTPAAIAIASGGTEARFQRVTFHYAAVRGYKVVTWTQHGLTYALVSREGNKTQRSCMVCHSAMRDRDLSDTPAPLRD